MLIHRGGIKFMEGIADEFATKDNITKDELAMRKETFLGTLELAVADAEKPPPVVRKRPAAAKSAEPVAPANTALLSLRHSGTFTDLAKTRTSAIVNASRIPPGPAHIG